MRMWRSHESRCRAYRALARRYNAQSQTQSLTMVETILKFDRAVGGEQIDALLDTMPLND